MMERVPGSDAAAPSPMTTRPAMSTSTSGATAAMIDPAQKIPTPLSITALRPNMSPRVPAANMKAANMRA